MKVVVALVPKTQEEQIVFNIHALTDEHRALMARVKADEQHDIIATKGEKRYRILIKGILYFESVDKKTFVYTQDDVSEVKEKLYQIAEKLAEQKFIRISKSMILNLKKVEMIYPTLSGRFEAELDNHERVTISRKYVSELKHMLGMKGRNVD